MNRIPLYFSIDEFLITPKAELDPVITQNIMEMIHFLNPIRHESGEPLIISKKSGYRPKWYELQKNRNGKSEHTTFTIPGRGAVDVTYKWEQFKMVYDAPFFTRICYYKNNGFYHCDRKPTTDGRLLYFEAQSLTSGWDYIGER